MKFIYSIIILFSCSFSYSQCFISTFNVNVAACNSTTGDYQVSGDVQFTNAPSSGQLVILVDNGINTYSQTFMAPFSSPQNYTIGGIPADGSSSQAIAYFTTDSSTCNSVVSYTAPPTCGCNAQVGTFTSSQNGQSDNSLVLCFGDTLNIVSNGNNVDPGLVSSPPGPIYDPGIGWFLYKCPPYFATSPTPAGSITSDSCFLALIDLADLQLINDMSIINTFPAGTFVDNTIYLVPATMYSESDQVLTYTPSTMPCYDLGAAFAVQLLSEINTSDTIDTFNHSVDITVSGGIPAINGSNFNASNLTPSTANLVNSTTVNNGVFTIENLVDGDVWSLDISDSTGCSFTLTDTFNLILNNQKYHSESSVYFNKKTSEIIITSTNPIAKVQVYSIEGKLVMSNNGLNSNFYTKATDHLKSGMYIVNLRLSNGELIRQQIHL